MILNGLDSLLYIINSDKQNKIYFAQFPVKTDIIHISIIGQTPKDQNCEDIDVVSNIGEKIDYKVDIPLPYDFPYLTVSEETFSEAQSILAHPDEVHRREVTFVQRDSTGYITELNGPWGMAIKRVVINQIESGRFEYYTTEDGVEKSFAVINGELVF